VSKSPNRFVPSGKLKALELREGSGIPVSNANSGRFRYNESVSKLEYSENGGPYVDVGAISMVAHAALRQLIHFIDEGPAESFATGAYKEVIGGLFPTSIIWYDSILPAKKKIVEKTVTWTGILPTTIEWKVYDAAEALLATVTDVISYTDMYETSRLRTIA
jgi:hypothetical protein